MSVHDLPLTALDSLKLDKALRASGDFAVIKRGKSGVRGHMLYPAIDENDVVIPNTVRLVYTPDLTGAETTAIEAVVSAHDGVADPQTVFDVTYLGSGPLADRPAFGDSIEGDVYSVTDRARPEIHEHQGGADWEVLTDARLFWPASLVR